MTYKTLFTSSALMLAFILTGCTDLPSPSIDREDTQQVNANRDDTHSNGPDNLDDHDEADDHDDHENHDKAESDVVKLSADAAKEAGIQTSTVRTGRMGQSLSLPAEIRFDADRIANVSPKISGVIGRLYASEGDDVRNGDRLALIRSRELVSLKAAWLTSKTRENLASKALAREENLFAEKITSEADLQTARAEFEAAKADSDAAENELHAAGVSDAALARIATAADGDNANAYLSSPIAGTVVRRTVTLGDTIVDDSVVWADIAVYKQDIGRIREGAAVALKTDDGTVLAQSKIAFLLPVIDEASRTATARVIVDNPNGDLRPGQFVTADLSVGSLNDVLRVPESAVQLVENQSSVFVPVDEGYAVRRVLIGVTSGGFVEIRSGLDAGEAIVTRGAFTLKAQLEKDAFGDDHGH